MYGNKDLKRERENCETGLVWYMCCVAVQVMLWRQLVRKGQLGSLMLSVLKCEDCGNDAAAGASHV